MLSGISGRKPRILAYFLCAALLFTLAARTRAQQVGPALLHAAQEAYRQAPQKQPEILAPVRPETQLCPPSEADWNNLKQLAVGAHIAVKTKDSVTHLGNFVAYSEEAISLRENKREVGYRREEVLSVSLLGARNRRKGALIGFLIGFAASIPFSAALLAQEDISGGAVTVIGGGAIWGGIGAAIGAAAAPRLQSLIYRAS